MATTEEISYRLETGPSGLRHLENEAAVANNVEEWLLTPVGTVADWPSWGNMLHKLKFHPHSATLETVAEMLIYEKIRYDIPAIRVHSVSVSFPEQDHCFVTLKTNYGGFEEAEVWL